MYKIVLLYLIVFFTLYGCKKYSFINVYDGYTFKGFHTRGIDINDNDLAFIAGKNGKLSVFDLTANAFILKDSIPNIEDFRDVEFVGDSSVLLLNSGNNGLIYKVVDTTKVVLNKPNVFLDGFSFFKKQDSIGFAYGDPTSNTFLIYKTTDYGNNWIRIDSTLIPKKILNEAGFAASGTGIVTPSTNVVYIASGVSDTARIFRSFNNGLNWDVVNTPIKSEKTFGIYSMCFKSKHKGFIVGGSYIDTLFNSKICYYTNNKCKSWKNRSNGLPGYISCIASDSKLKLIVVTGRLGTYFSANKGKTWKILTEKSFYSCTVTKNRIVLVGKNGKFNVFTY